MPVQGKVMKEDVAVFIAGAGSGIGKATALRFAARGARVACADIDLDAASRVAAEASGRPAIAIALDVTSETSWREAIDRAGREFGSIAVFVNSAGISSGSPVTQTTYDEWRKVMAINLDGVFLGTRIAVEYMRGKAIGGSIVNVSSASGVKAAPGASAYSTSKAAVIMFSQVVAKECAIARDGIRVNVVSPAGVRTPMWSSMPFFRQLVEEKGSEAAAFAAVAEASGVERLAEPEEIAAAIAYLASDEARYVTGVNLVIDGGYTL